MTTDQHLSGGAEVWDGAAHCRECDPGPAGCPGLDAARLIEAAAALSREALVHVAASLAGGTVTAPSPQPVPPPQEETTEELIDRAVTLTEELGDVLAEIRDRGLTP